MSDLMSDPPETAKRRTAEEWKALELSLAAASGGLELFDVWRRPRKPLRPSVLRQVTRLSNSGLADDLSCPICRGIYQRTMVVKDCLHRFCSECIEKWLRSGKQDCPQCRIKIASRRALRSDPIFDRMIDRLFPDVVDFETRNDELINQANKRRRSAAATGNRNGSTCYELERQDILQNGNTSRDGHELESVSDEQPKSAPMQESHEILTVADAVRYRTKVIPLMVVTTLQAGMGGGQRKRRREALPLQSGASGQL